MAETSECDLNEYIRAVQVRMMRHSFDHLPGMFDARTAMIVVNNGLLKSPLKSPLPEELFKIVEDPNHPQRWSGSRGPLIVFRQGEKARGIIELATVFLNPELEVRKAALAELDRQVKQHQQLISPETQRRIDEIRDIAVSDDVRQSIAASIEINDRLDDDYFYHLEGVRQCAGLHIYDELPHFFERVLAPNERTIQFLLKLPVWSPHRQRSDIERKRDQILDSATSITELLSKYFRLFGHLPLAGQNSAAGVIAAWCKKHGEPVDPWTEVWSWAKNNGSGLARYHACQLLSRTPSWVSEEHRSDLLNLIAEIVEGHSYDDHWKLRCDLARHYCRHLESLTPGADGERVAACSWWLSEYLCETVEAFSDEASQLCASMLEKACGISDEVWIIGRPPVGLSTLRYGTLFSTSIWSTALLCELSDSYLLEYVDQHEGLIDTIAASLHKLAYVALDRSNENDNVDYAFEGRTVALTDRLTKLVDATMMDSMRRSQKILEIVRNDNGLGIMVKQLSDSHESEAEEIAHELRLVAFCGVPPCEELWDSFSDAEWRKEVLVGGEQECVELICNAAIEVQLHDSSRDWRSYLPHFFALACEEAPLNNERKRLLFAYTVVSSLAVNSVSAVERLLKGEHRRDYEDFVLKWRERIERVMPVAPAWIGAKLRGMKAAFYID